LSIDFAQKNIGKQITKNQHIVPQRHLKLFSTPNDANKVKSFDCDQLKILNKDSSIRSICSGYFHYALNSGNEDEYSQVVEDAFGNLETWYGDNIERIEGLLLARKKLNDSDRFGISCVVANFYFRGKNFRSEMLSVSQKMVDWMQPIVSKYIFKEASKKYPDFFTNDSENRKVVEQVARTELSREVSKTSHATQVAFDVGHANTLTHKKWEIFLNNSKYPFITSDEAVIDLMNLKIPKNYSLRGSWLLKTQIFNLSPRVSIVFSFPFTENMHGQTNYEEISRSRKNIFKQNLYYVNFSHKYAYSSNSNFFEDIMAFENRK